MRISEITTAAPPAAFNFSSASSPLTARNSWKRLRRCRASPSNTRGSSSTHNTRGRYSSVMWMLQLTNLCNESFRLAPVEWRSKRRQVLCVHGRREVRDTAQSGQCSRIADLVCNCERRKHVEFGLLHALRG